MIYYPAGYETILAVGALNKDGTEIAYFSQRGSWVDVFAATNFYPPSAEQSIKILRSKSLSTPAIGTK